MAAAIALAAACMVSVAGPASAGSAPSPDLAPRVDSAAASGSSSSSGSAVNRIAGADRYATAAAIAERFGSADAVIVANGQNVKQGFDALAANYLAGQLHAPILLTEAAQLPAQTAAAVRSVLTGAANPSVYVMGKSDSVSDAVVQQLGEIADQAAGGTASPAGGRVHRIGGDSRYVTATLAVTAAPGSTVGSVSLGSGQPALRTAILASGQVNADALAAGSISYRLGLPVLLTPPTVLPPAVATEIGRVGIAQLIVLGGPDRVSDGLLASARSAGVQSITRIAGDDRFATAVALYRATAALDRPAGSAVDQVFLANGLAGFPDALTVGALAGSLGAPLLTISSAPALPAAVADLVGDAASGMCTAAVTVFTGLGQSDRVTDAALADAARRCRDHDRTPPVSSDVGQMISLLNALVVKPKAPFDGYDRVGQFGEAWTDDVSVAGGHNGCDTRDDILRRDLINVVIKAGSGGCFVASGVLHDPYTGQTINFLRGWDTSGLVQIDHIVALADAWKSGAQELTQASRINLANDPLNLLAVDAPTNQEKRAYDASEWLPPNVSFRCAYVSRQVQVKSKYHLSVTQNEKSAILDVLDSCDETGQSLPIDPPAISLG